MVLNALGIDPASSWKGPWRWWSEDLLLQRWPAAAATLAGPQRGVEDIRRAGMSLHELAALSRACGLHASERRAADCSPADFRAAVLQALGCGASCGEGDSHVHSPFGGRGGTHVVVSFDRRAQGQTGGGHFSPLGGYSRRHGMVLVMARSDFRVSIAAPHALACRMWPGSSTRRTG
jgi:glutathione gamma-glutamylcysteinyltransferase